MRFFRLGRQGAILLEALMAVVILAVGLTFTLQAIMQHLRSSVVAQEYYLAAQALDTSMTAALFASLKSGKIPAYSCSMEDKKYQCTVTARGTIQSPNPDIVFVSEDVKLSWPSVKGERAIDIPFYIAKGKE